MADKLSTTYFPNPVPDDIRDRKRFLELEFEQIATAIRELGSLHVNEVFREPEKPRIGDIRLADGEKWNPGSGHGLYVYLRTGWRPIGL